jgi:hypothetical protein
MLVYFTLTFKIIWPKALNNYTINYTFNHNYKNSYNWKRIISTEMSAGGEETKSRCVGAGLAYAGMALHCIRIFGNISQQILFAPMVNTKLNNSTLVTAILFKALTYSDKICHSHSQSLTLSSIQMLSFKTTWKLHRNSVPLWLSPWK